MNKRTEKNNRKGISILELTRMFPNEQTAMQWFENVRWGDRRCCSHCNSEATMQTGGNTPMPYRCKDCRKFFSVKTGTIMEKSKVSYQKWAFGIYLISTSLKGIASLKLHRDLDMTQTTAWRLSHKIREGFIANGIKLEGIIEVDETYIGGKEKNKHRTKKLNSGRGAVGKLAVVGLKKRGGKIKAMPSINIDKEALQGLIHEHVETGSTVYTDDHRSYIGLKGYKHSSVKHSAREYVRRQAHTNGIESFWSLLKRGYHGTHHHMSHKHLHRYVNEFAGRHNVRGVDTIAQMAALVKGFEGKQLRCKDLVA